MSNYLLFPTNFVWWDTVENHLDIKEKYLRRIEQSKSKISKKQNWDCDVVSSFGNQYINDSIFDKYFRDNVIWKYFDRMLEKKPFEFDTPHSSIVRDIWYNTYTRGQYQEIHTHDYVSSYSSELKIKTMGMFSGIYLIDLQEKNKTVFYQQGPLPCRVNTDGVYVKSDHLNEGSIILFPSSLAHYVLPTEKSRTTISFNVTSSYFYQEDS